MSSEASSDSSGRNYSLAGLFDEVRDTAEGNEVSIGEIIKTFSHQAYGPLLLIPSVIALTPIIGAIPGVSVLTAAMIIFVAAQMIFGRDHPWLPAWMRKFALDRDKVDKGVDAMKPYLEAMDRWTRPRLLMLSKPPLNVVIAVVCILLAILMIPLALVPWGVTLPALALTIMSIGLTVRDGYLLAAGYAITVISVFAALWLL